MKYYDFSEATIRFLFALGAGLSLVLFSLMLVGAFKLFFCTW